MVPVCHMAESRGLPLSLPDPVAFACWLHLSVPKQTDRPRLAAGPPP
jgi:hypothetical protein